jgi:hypothetical protein
MMGFATLYPSYSLTTSPLREAPICHDRDSEAVRGRIAVTSFASVSLW